MGCVMPVTIKCALCRQALPVIPTDNPEMPVQAVFTVKDGQRVHVPPCPPKPMHPNENTGD